MVIGKDKKRVMITMSMDLYNQLLKEADHDNRSLSNYVVDILINRKKIKN
jgi:predicted CopG family antitoxin